METEGQAGRRAKRRPSWNGILIAVICLTGSALVGCAFGSSPSSTTPSSPGPSRPAPSSAGSAGTSTPPSASAAPVTSTPPDTAAPSASAAPVTSTPPDTTPPDTATPGTSAAPSGTTGDVEAWTLRAEAPLPLTEHAAAAFEGEIWTAGGYGADGLPVAAVQVYDPVRDAWRAGPALPEPIHHAALVATDGGLVLLGGYRSTDFASPTDAVLRLDPGSDAWVPDVPLPEPHGAGAAAWDGSRIVFAGGVGPGGVSPLVVALEEGAWRRLPSLTQAREHLGAASDGAGSTWFLGGRTGGIDANLSTVDLVTSDEVRALPDLPTARGGVGAFWSAATGACLVGGEAPEGTFREVECVDIDGAIRTLPALAEPRHGMGAAVVDGTAYVMLGGPEPGLTVSGTVQSLAVEP